MGAACVLARKQCNVRFAHVRWALRQAEVGIRLENILGRKLFALPLQAVDDIGRDEHRPAGGLSAASLLVAQEGAAMCGTV